jgi:hypothetical protein
MHVTFQVWYMRPEWFIEGNAARRKPDPTNLDKTHVHLLDRTFLGDDGEATLESIYQTMQASVWSPNGEAHDLIKAKRLSHTGMSIGDVVVDSRGVAHVVALFGFEALGAVIKGDA